MLKKTSVGAGQPGHPKATVKFCGVFFTSCHNGISCFGADIEIACSGNTHLLRQALALVT